MKNVKFILGIGFTVLFFACSQNKEIMEMATMSEEVAMEEIPTESPPPSDYVSSSAAVENKQDTTRKFIRAADLRFEVKDVIKSTYDIEDITNRQEGFVTYTHLTSEINRVAATPISADSSLVSTYYTVVNTIVLRVPNVRLDTTLKEIARNIKFLDYRTIKAQDVALQILTNDLTQKRIAKNEERLTKAIDNRGKKLYETASAEELLLNKQEQADNAKISNLSLADQINFSTINLSIYQRQTIKREVIANDKNINAYQLGLGTKLIEACRFGWDILTTVIVFIVKLWGLILFGILAYILYRRYKKKNLSE
jgi:hypothetical protein